MGRGAAGTKARSGDRPGRVVETVGRRVVVSDEHGVRNCFLSGHRAVVGDRVQWTEAPGEGGKVTAVEPRTSVLRRVDPRGDEQILAANVHGLFVVFAATDPPLAAPLLDRYLLAAEYDGLKVVVVLNKSDLPVSDAVAAELDQRAAWGFPVVRVSTKTGEGLAHLRAVLGEAIGPWALVGPSGVGKTSIAAALLPEQDVGPVGEISEYWGQGRHTTTWTRLFQVPGGGELADSPGIRGLIPAVLDPEAIRDHYPGLAGLGCRYRDCLHRSGEDGCVAEGTVPGPTLLAYRTLVTEAEGIRRRRGPDGRGRPTG